MNLHPLTFFQLNWVVGIHKFLLSSNQSVTSQNWTTAHDETEWSSTHQYWHWNGNESLCLECRVNTDDQSEQSTDHESHHGTVKHVNFRTWSCFLQFFNFFWEFRWLIDFDEVLLVLGLTDKLFIRIVWER